MTDARSGRVLRVVEIGTLAVLAPLWLLCRGLELGFRLYRRCKGEREHRADGSIPKT